MAPRYGIKQQKPKGSGGTGGIADATSKANKYTLPGMVLVGQTRQIYHSVRGCPLPSMGAI